MSILLLGQAPSATSGRTPLDERSGARLARLVGAEPEQLGEFFALGNLLSRYPGKGRSGDLFPILEARRNARAMVTVLAEFHAILLLGRNVARVFDMGDVSYFEWRPCFELDGVVVKVPVAVMPHPSGVSRWWNEPMNRILAGEFMRRTVESAVMLRPLEVPLERFADGARV